MADLNSLQGLASAGVTEAAAPVHVQKLDSNGRESSLTGTFADQAQLHGLLDRLRDLGIPIVSVNPVS